MVENTNSDWLCDMLLYSKILRNMSFFNQSLIYISTKWNKYTITSKGHCKIAPPFWIVKRISLKVWWHRYSFGIKWSRRPRTNNICNNCRRSRPQAVINYSIANKSDEDRIFRVFCNWIKLIISLCSFRFN